MLESGRRFVARPGLLARLFAPALEPVLARMHAGLAKGRLRAVLPDGTPRVLGGHAPGFEAQITLRHWRGLLRVVTGGSIGLYEGWAAGEWDSDDPVALFALFVANSAALGDVARAKGPTRWAARLMHRARRNTRRQAERNIHAHYDLGNDFYAAWLDPTMTYSSAYRLGDAGLESAQRAKWQRLAERLGQGENAPETLLEIGCGWGALSAHFAAQGTRTTAISLSDQQLQWARDRHPAVEFLKCDYRDMDGRFDAIVSVEMVEALGREYWPTFMDCLARNLVSGGRAAIQYIAMADHLFDAYAANPDFIQAYVFPGGMLIRASEFRALAEARGLRWTDQEDFALDYAATLKAWRERFDAAVNEGRLPAGFDQRFIQLWRFYLMYCEGGFRGGGITVSQVTLIKETT